MSEDRVGRYRLLRRITEGPIELRTGAGDAPRVAGSRMLADAERQGDAAPRRLYVVAVPESDTRELLADSLLACVSLKHGNVIPLLDAGVFGERVYGAMMLDGAVPLARLVAAIQAAPRGERELLVAAIGADVALGLQAGHDLASRGLVHDALDLESIVVDKEGRGRVDGIFLDPWIASETIAASATPFVAPERWRAPGGLGTDVYALGRILAHLLDVKEPETPSIDVIAAACSPSPERRPRSAHDIADRLSKGFDVNTARRALANLVDSLDSPVSETRIGLGGPAGGKLLPRVLPPRPDKGARGVKTPPAARPVDIDAPPQTSRMGSLEVAEAEAESDATVVERSPLFDSGRAGPQPRAVEERRPPARHDENTPIAIDIPSVAGAMRGADGDDDDDDDEEEQGTVVAPLWSAAMAKADASREDSDIRASGGRPMDLRQSSSARGWEVKTGSRALAGRAPAPAKDALPLGRIPQAPAFPIEPAREKHAKPVQISALPVLWSEDSSSDSDMKTRGRPPIPQAPTVPAEPMRTAAQEERRNEPSPVVVPSSEVAIPHRPKVDVVRLVLALVVLAAVSVVVVVFLTRR